MKLENVIKADIAVIGGGAAGISAAIEAKKTAPELKVVIAERLDRTGKKILSTGNGRCNLSNRNLTREAYHGSVSNVMDIISKTQKTEDYFRSLGVLCVADEAGRIYPYSRSANSVLSALRMKLKTENIPEICGFEAVSIERRKNGITVLSADGRQINCRKLIAACGGYASPANGTDGKAIKMFRDMGVRTEKICPAVAPLRVSKEELKGLKGVRVHGRVTAFSGNTVLAEESGEIQFTESAISGICVFNLAWLFSEYEGKLSLSADLMPEMSLKQIERIIEETAEKRALFTLEELLNGIFVKNLAVYIVKKAVKRPLNDLISTLTKNEISEIAFLIKSMTFKVTGCSSWQNAQVTSGGIAGSEVDENLCMKKFCDIYLAGEILDVDGLCGGYNLEWAWSSGMMAGRCSAKELCKT